MKTVFSMKERKKAFKNDLFFPLITKLKVVTLLITN
jgi:hypothetical protein